MILGFIQLIVKFWKWLFRSKNDFHAGTSLLIDVDNLSESEFAEFAEFAE